MKYEIDSGINYASSAIKVNIDCDELVILCEDRDKYDDLVRGIRDAVTEYDALVIALKYGRIYNKSMSGLANLLHKLWSLEYKSYGKFYSEVHRPLVHYALRFGLIE